MVILHPLLANMEPPVGCGLAYQFGRMQLNIVELLLKGIGKSCYCPIDFIIRVTGGAGW